MKENHVNKTILQVARTGGYQIGHRRITTNYPITTVLPTPPHCFITEEQRRFSRTGNLYTQDGRATRARGEAAVPPHSLKALAWLDLPGNVATYCFVEVNLRIGQ